MDSANGTERVRNVRQTVHEFWETRPERPREGTKVGGVAAAIGRRYGIDPVLPRVAFVVAAFSGGAGVVLYLLGWLLLPKEGEPQTQHVTSGRRTVALVLVLLLALSLTYRTGLFALALCLLALYLLHVYRGHPQIEPPEAGEATADPETAEQQSPPSWDPLGAAPIAWDLPEPGAPEPAPAPPRRRWITLLTLALAALAAGFGLALGVSTGTALAVALGVLGLGMLVGAFLRSARALVWCAIPIAVLAMVFGSVSSNSWTPPGNSVFWAATVPDVRPSYYTSFGNLQLHLDHMQLRPGQEIHTSAEVGMGNVTVFVPRDADVTARCSARLGSVRCLNGQYGGQGATASTESPGSGGHIVLDLTAGTGNVEVIRD